MTLSTVACQAPLSMGFSRQEYWRGLPCPPPGDLLDPRIKPVSLVSPALAGWFFTTSIIWEASRPFLSASKEGTYMCYCPQILITSCWDGDYSYSNFTKEKRRLRDMKHTIQGPTSEHMRQRACTWHLCAVLPPTRRWWLLTLFVPGCVFNTSHVLYHLILITTLRSLWDNSLIILV